MNRLFLITIFVGAGGQSKSQKAAVELTKEYEEAIARSVHEPHRRWEVS